MIAHIYGRNIAGGDEGICNYYYEFYKVGSEDANTLRKGSVLHLRNQGIESLIYKIIGDLFDKKELSNE